MAEIGAALAVMTTTDSAELAERLAAGAVERRLAACAQISAPVTSCYRWEGEIRTDREWQVLLKTTDERFGDLERYLKEAHSYDLPEIIAFPVVRGSADYLRWVSAETTAPAG
ncbi:divalent-cation tolerance protein CutA [Streptomyces aidingensis]|uniref:Divalent cation tolerance protein n=1 Tax=Streptomyces aidingensis TaxID=910347 RepID=A0A1I1FSG5_9ACTN|nr:divalent-cation tolerance protein CutA [Streptomyces aidingensis]SFC02377.1 divalent cation tolerance protein [Streptomyces aidingensis]